jgi:hypothetical protein
MTDGSINEDVLRNWIKEAQSRCAETHHMNWCNLEIWYLLAHSPSNPDGVWPHIAVRDIIEELNNDMIDKHIACEFRNKRGGTSRSPLEGWEQERKLVATYKDMGDKTILWPRTSMILRDITESYEHEAKRHDVDANLRELF